MSDLTAAQQIVNQLIDHASPSGNPDSLHRRAAAFIEQQAEQIARLQAVIVEADMTQRAIHMSWVNNQPDWLKALIIEQTTRFDSLHVKEEV